MDEETRACYPKGSGLCAANSRRTSGDLCCVRGWVTRLESTLGSVRSVRSGHMSVWVMGEGGPQGKASRQVNWSPDCSSAQGGNADLNSQPGPLARGWGWGWGRRSTTSLSYVHICFPGKGEILFTGPTPLQVRHVQKAFGKMCNTSESLHTGHSHVLVS